MIIPIKGKVAWRLQLGLEACHLFTSTTSCLCTQCLCSYSQVCSH